MPSSAPTTVRSRQRGRFASVALALALALPAAVAAPADPATAATDAYPTWDEVEAARGSETAKQRQITRLGGAIDELQAATAAAAARSAEAGAAYQKAQDALDDASGHYEQLVTELDAERKHAAELAATVGQVAASLAKPGGGSPTTKLLSGEGDPGEVLRGLGLSSQIGQRVASLQKAATVAARVVESKSDQAKVAREALRAKSDIAADALAEATRATQAASTAEAAQRDNLGVMQAQLATLQNDTLSIEQGYRDGVAARAAAAAAAAAERARIERERQAAAARAAAEAERQRAAAAAAAPSAGSGGSALLTSPRPSSPSPSTGPSSANGWTRPITSYSFYQAYGYRLHPVYHDYRLHAGADFSASCGTPILSTAAGTVTYAGPYGGYGNLIVVDHGNGITSAYGHVFASGIYVSVGQRVSEGQNIAGVGNAGVSTGCHLHFEIRRGGIATDPMAYLATKGVS